MKIHAVDTVLGHRITAYGDGFITVDEEEIRRSLVIMPDRLVRDWLSQGQQLPDIDAMRALTALGVEIVLLGTGHRQRFPPAEQFALLNAAGIGLEVMDTSAACRTYNILAAEGRRVAAALVVGAG